MRKKLSHFLLISFTSILFLCACGKDKNTLQTQLLPLISEAYKNGNWNHVILLTDSLRNNGVAYTEYIGNNGIDIPYNEALIATNNADKAVKEIESHLNKVNPKDFYAYHTVGVAYCALHDTIKAIDAFSNSIKIKPGYARPYLHLAHLYAAKDKEKCMDNYSPAIQLLGNHQMYDDVLRLGFESWDVDSTNYIILKYMGDACLAKEDIQKAEILYGRVVGYASEKGSTVPHVFFESDYQLALINYIEGNYKEAYILLEAIYANENGFPKSSNSVLFYAYVLGVAVTQKMSEPLVSSKLLELAKEIDSQEAKEHYDYFHS